MIQKTTEYYEIDLGRIWENHKKAVLAFGFIFLVTILSAILVIGMAFRGIPKVEDEAQLERENTEMQQKYDNLKKTKAAENKKLQIERNRILQIAVRSSIYKQKPVWAWRKDKTSLFLDSLQLKAQQPTLNLMASFIPQSHAAQKLQVPKVVMASVKPDLAKTRLSATFLTSAVSILNAIKDMWPKERKSQQPEMATAKSQPQATKTQQSAVTKVVMPPLQPTLKQVSVKVTTPCAARSVTVKEGDMLSWIAKNEMHAASLYLVLAATNGITNPDQIQPGQVILIPCTFTTPKQSLQAQLKRPGRTSAPMAKAISVPAKTAMKAASKTAEVEVSVPEQIMAPLPLPERAYYLLASVAPATLVVSTEMTESSNMEAGNLPSAAPNAASMVNVSQPITRTLTSYIGPGTYEIPVAPQAVNGKLGRFPGLYVEHLDGDVWNTRKIISVNIRKDPNGKLFLCDMQLTGQPGNDAQIVFDLGKDAKFIPQFTSEDLNQAYRAKQPVPQPKRDTFLLQKFPTTPKKPNKVLSAMQNRFVSHALHYTLIGLYPAIGIATGNPLPAITTALAIGQQHVQNRIMNNNQQVQQIHQNDRMEQLEERVLELEKENQDVRDFLRPKNPDSDQQDSKNADPPAQEQQ